MKTLWEQLSEETREKLTNKDIEFDRDLGSQSNGIRYWFNRFSAIDHLFDLRIDQWRHLKNDLGLDTIDEAYWKILEEVSDEA